MGHVARPEIQKGILNMDFPGACVSESVSAHDVGSGSAGQNNHVRSDQVNRIRLSAAQPIVIDDIDQEVLSANLKRSFLWVENQSVYVWRLAFSVAAVSGFGLVLAPSQRIVFDYSIPVSSIHLVSDSIGKGQGVIMEGTGL